MYLVLLQQRSLRNNDKKTKFFTADKLRPRVRNLKIKRIGESHRPDAETELRRITAGGGFVSGVHSSSPSSDTSRETDHLVPQNSPVHASGSSSTSDDNKNDINHSANYQLPRVMGKLATSRSMGKLPEGLKPHVSSTPETFVVLLNEDTRTAKTTTLDKKMKNKFTTSSNEKMDTFNHVENDNEHEQDEQHEEGTKSSKKVTNSEQDSSTAISLPAGDDTRRSPTPTSSSSSSTTTDDIIARKEDVSWNFVLIASDGLFEVLSAYESCEIVEAVLRTSSVQDVDLAARQLVETALQRGASDNVSAVVVKLQ